MTPEDLKRIREGMSWTQAEAAAKVGVQKNSWARWERGELAVHPARVRDLEALLRRAEVNMRRRSGD